MHSPSYGASAASHSTLPHPHTYYPSYPCYPAYHPSAAVAGYPHPLPSQTELQQQVLSPELLSQTTPTPPSQQPIFAAPMNTHSPMWPTKAPEQAMSNTQVPHGAAMGMPNNSFAENMSTLRFRDLHYAQMRPSSDPASEIIATQRQIASLNNLAELSPSTNGGASRAHYVSAADMAYIVDAIANAKLSPSASNGNQIVTDVKRAAGEVGSGKNADASKLAVGSAVTQQTANQLLFVLSVWYPNRAPELARMMLANHTQKAMAWYLRHKDQLRLKINKYLQLLSVAQPWGSASAATQASLSNDFGK